MIERLPRNPMKHTPQQEPRRTILSSLAEVAQAIGHMNRLELLEFLAQGPRTVEELTELGSMSYANTSRNLQILKRARLVETERQGKYVLYSLSGQKEVTLLLKALGKVGERNRAEVQQVMQSYFHDRDALAPMSRHELLQRLGDGTVTLLDVRPEHEFAVGHLPGALNIPLPELEHKLACLPKNQEIIAYCRGPYCVLSAEATIVLRSAGYHVRRLEDGFPEWKAAGLVVETDVV